MPVANVVAVGGGVASEGGGAGVGARQSEGDAGGTLLLMLLGELLRVTGGGAEEEGEEEEEGVEEDVEEDVEDEELLDATFVPAEVDFVRNLPSVPFTLLPIFFAASAVSAATSRPCDMSFFESCIEPSL